ncbi:hypothetical protein ASE27_03700 [Oerskovia sp. Root918]|nr:hypothetical protein ASE15_13655 [Oerskovia sp. Root22]KRD47441.1 hypothetical protein ASE27_03700 [Oerskovia sp. Root918]
MPVRHDDRPRRTAGALVLGAAVLPLLAACGVGDDVVACALVMHASTLEVRLADSWPDREAFDVAVECPPGTGGCDLVRAGTVQLVPAPDAPPIADLSGGADPSVAAPSDGSADAPAAPSPPTVTGPVWTGTTFSPPSEVVVTVERTSTGDVALDRVVELDWRAESPDDDCPGPRTVTVVLDEE